jgi:biofilm PGA synthesis N-glycosyltransferase PgaC
MDTPVHDNNKLRAERVKPLQEDAPDAAHLKEAPPHAKKPLPSFAETSPSYQRVLFKLLFPGRDGKHYVSVRSKFFIANLIALLWAALSLYLSLPWTKDLASYIGYPLAVTIIAGIAIIPGFMNAFLVVSLMLDRRPPHAALPSRYPSLSILIAAYKEEDNILGTLESIDRQGYPGNLQVIVINDGSPDATAERVRSVQAKYPWLDLLDLHKNGGKAKALNAGLRHVKHQLVLTVDGDSYLYNNALKNIVERYMNDPVDTAAVAGCVLVRNSRLNWLSKVQEWDYFHGIASIKRIQSLFQGTLVAQGAFSLYRKSVLEGVGGWPDCVGEDIVLTWAMLKEGHRVGFCEDACAFTNVPATLPQFIRQRQRWSRGMIEAFKQHPGILVTPRLSTFFVYWNLLFPMLDLIFTVVFLPGLVLALLGHYWIAGPMTLVLLPLAGLINILMFSVGRKMFDANGLAVRRNISGFLLYALVYSIILQPACLLGYVSELFKLKKSWGTK